MDSEAAGCSGATRGRQGLLRSAIGRKQDRERNEQTDFFFFFFKGREVKINETIEGVRDKTRRERKI